MKIALMSQTFINNDIDYNYNQIIQSINKLASKVDLICFGEAFLQGFDSLTWKYEVDKNIAITINDDIINKIRLKAGKEKVAVSFGYIEKANDKLYCSYIFIGDDGNIITNYRRVSIGWKEYSITDYHYCEGIAFSNFIYHDIKIVIALCGDLWDEENVLKINELDKNIILWPMYVSYSIEEWKSEREEYLKQACKLKVPILFINSICQKYNSLGGCYLYKDNKIEKSLELGREGVLIVEI